MFIITISYTKLAKGIFALDGRDGNSRNLKNLDRLKRQAESDKVKFNRNKHRILKLHSRKTTNNSPIKIIPGFSSRVPDVSQQKVTS